MLYLMNKMKCISIALLAMAFLGCKAERAGSKKSSVAEAVPAKASEKSGEQNPPKKEWLYSDAELDEFLRRNEVSERNPLAYYYAGNRCADKGEYQEAVKLYALAVEAFHSRSYEYRKDGIDWDWKEEESYPGTLDENGECKEFYYSIYNLSCCMSLLGFLELSEAYLYNAIIAGYPHLNHLLSDPDLANLYGGPNGEAVKARAKELFACGSSTDFLRGKKVPQLSMDIAWYFNFDKNGKDVFCYSYYDGEDPWNSERPWVMKGTYTVKNFHVLIRFDSVWEREPVGYKMWPGHGIDPIDGPYDTYWFPVITSKPYQYNLYMLSSAGAFRGLRCWEDFSLDEKDDLVCGTFLESVSRPENNDHYFLRSSCVNLLDKVFREAEAVKWSPEDSEKNRELNGLNETRRSKQAATALIELSEEEIDANARRRLARYREFADPIIQGYKEKGKVVTLDAATFASSGESDALPQETEFCYVFIKGTVENSAAFESICKAAEKRFVAGFFLDFTDCTFAGRRHFEEGDYNSPEWFHFEVNDRNGSSLSDRDGETPQAVGIKGIIFPKNIPDRISIYYANSSLEIMEFQDSAFPQDIDFGYYKAHENNSLKAVRLPEGLKEIDDFAFMNCIELKQVYAPKSLERIGHHAFDKCNGLTFEIPEHVRYVRERVFGPQTQLYIPAYRHHHENFDWYYSCFDYTGENVHWGKCVE